jgi:hypothetical protein
MCLFIIDKQVGCHDHKLDDPLGKSSNKLAETLKWVLQKHKFTLKIEPGQYHTQLCMEVIMLKKKLT